MFDPKVPQNNLQKLPGSFDFHNKNLYLKALEAQKSLAKLNGLLHLLPNADILVTPLITAESVSSSAIENINTTTIEVLKAQALPQDFRLGAEKEVLHYREAILYGYKLIQENNFLITNDLIEIQNIIEPNKSGIRSIPWTVIGNSRGEVLYTPPQGKDVILDLLSNLEQFLNNQADEIYPLIKTGVIHYQFEAIHPFYDGNGRTGRILMILYLMMTKLLDYPVLFLSWYINTHKNAYYQALNATHKSDDYSTIISYILEAILVQSNITCNKIIGIQQLIQYLEKQIPLVIKNDHWRIIRTLLQNPFISLQNFADSIWVTRITAKSYVEKMKAADLVRVTEVGKYSLISVVWFIELLSE